jgi:hypothetical protein
LGRKLPDFAAKGSAGDATTIKDDLRYADLVLGEAVIDGKTMTIA